MDDTFSVILALLIILSIPVIIFCGLFVKFSSIGKGEHSGFITAVDQRGYIFRNYDVYFKTDNSSSQEDTYCINRADTDLIKQAFEANRKRKQVTLEYQGVRGIGLGLCGNTQITAIK